MRRDVVDHAAAVSAARLDQLDATVRRIASSSAAPGGGSRLPFEVRFAHLTAAQVASHFPGGVAPATSTFYGWALADGLDGRPNMMDAYLRLAMEAGNPAGSGDGSHTHAIDHDHGSFTSGSESGHTHGAAQVTNGSLRACITLNSSDEKIRADVTATNGAFTADRETGALGELIGTSTTAETTAAIVMGETAAGSAHSHSVDVPALAGASGEHEGPARYHLVPLVWAADYA